ncbi:alpha/beta fold hydrolase [Streptomyces sp. RY43-2]|uniref:Alpha/beta fold hydrolase n=1 Tax=Streptomyces macrolidinus TaxID=2952607 RepID=A0ABT0ZLA9_9ACTN|nr:alpha/beta fold hydrolase [Streptomyces macrolidinus]MCN9244374.1 alpha/beta fold hydrolase [Streptomyces macrolidinus]
MNDRARQEDGGLWLRRFHPSPDRTVHLVCLPHAGGSASYYFRFSAELHPSIEVLAVQYPGRQDRRNEPCVESVDELAQHVVRATEPYWQEGRLALFGHSLGASVAYEAARILEQKHGVRLDGLYVSGRRAPSRPQDRTVHQLDDRSFLAEIQQLSGTDDGVFRDEELVRMVLPALRSDYKAAETYTYRPGLKLECPVMALTGDSDPRAPLAEVAEWRKFTRGSFCLRAYPGGHFYLNDLWHELCNDISDHMLVTREEPGTEPRTGFLRGAANPWQQHQR